MRQRPVNKAKLVVSSHGIAIKDNCAMASSHKMDILSIQLICMKKIIKPLKMSIL